ncbi:hypothetical protein LCGC14_3074720, partial [marine sediment metagenome]
ILELVDSNQEDFPNKFSKSEQLAANVIGMLVSDNKIPVSLLRVLKDVIVWEVSGQENKDIEYRFFHIEEYREDILTFKNLYRG